MNFFRQTLDLLGGKAVERIEEMDLEAARSGRAGDADLSGDPHDGHRLRSGHRRVGGDRGKGAAEGVAVQPRPVTRVIMMWPFRLRITPARPMM